MSNINRDLDIKKSPSKSPSDSKGKKMLVRTNFAKPSARESTDMHSRSGKTTISKYKVFSVPYTGKQAKARIENNRQANLYQALNMVPEQIDPRTEEEGLQVMFKQLDKESKRTQQQS